MNHDEDGHRVSGQEDAFTSTGKYNSTDRVIDGIGHRFELDPDESFDSGAGEYDSLDEFIDSTDDFILEMEDFDHQIDMQIDSIDNYFMDMKRLDEDIDDIHYINETTYLNCPFDDGTDRSSESDTEEFVYPDTDENDSAGSLGDDMFHALGQMALSLCLACRNLSQGIFRVDETCDFEYLTHHLCLSSLQQSVEDGCRMCMAVAQSLEDFCKKPDPPIIQKESWSIKGLLNYNKYHQNPDSNLHLSFWLCQCEHNHPYGSICEGSKTLRTFDFYPARTLRLGPEFLGVLDDRCYCLLTAPTNLSGSDPALMMSSAKSATSLSVARSWYQQCLNHEACRNWRQGSRFLPTRLVKIWRPENQSTGLSARICETGNMPASTRYVTLSHCWGKGVIFKLLQNNIEQLSQAIPIGQLPKVFQDAIYVSHELGIGYIWIDSLCIIQDSKEDWTYEAKRMGGVYSNGEFNIAATGYEDGLSGLFGERKALSLIHIPMRAECEFIDAQYKTQAVFKGLYISASIEEWGSKVVFSPLNDRGWVAQERTLSPAVIHYTPEKMYWECNQSIASEAFLNVPNFWDNTQGTGRYRIRSLSAQSDREDIYSFWRTFLSRYAGMEMTFNRDRIPAVAGIARILSELIDDNFVAGFFEGDLLRSLVLERHVSYRHAIKPEQLAPSWSWVSMNADTNMLTIDVSKLQPLNGVHFQVLSDIPGFKSDLQLPSLEKSGVRGLAVRGALRKLLDDFNNQEEWIWSSQLMYDNKEAAKYLGDKLPQDQAWRSSDPTHMLLLTRWVNPSMDSFIYVHGLLVQPAELNEANTFRRSGTIELIFRNDEVCDKCLGLREKDGEYEPSALFEESGLQDLVLM